MEKAALDMVKAVQNIKPKNSADFKPQLLEVLGKLDQLSKQDQRDFADVMEGELTRSWDDFSKKDIEEFKSNFCAADPDAPQDEFYVEFDNEMKGSMVLFKVIGAIKGDEASDFVKKTVAGCEALEENGKDDVVSLMKVLYKAKNPQSGFLGETKTLAKQSAKGFLAPLKAVYNRVTGQKSDTDKKPDHDDAAPKKPSPKRPKR